MSKVWIGSEGTVWSSQFMQMQHSESLLFTAEQKDNVEYIKSALNKYRVKLMDTKKLYEISSQKKDVLNISLNRTESCNER